jgi:two-component system NtrC family sensor kinase
MKLRYKIIISMLLLVALSGGITALVGGFLLWRQLKGQTEAIVIRQLDTLDRNYRRRLEEMAAALRFTAIGERFSQAVEAGEVGYLSSRLDAVKRMARVDILTVIDKTGRVIWRAHRPGVRGDRLAPNQMVKNALSGREPLAALLASDIDYLRAEAPELAARIEQENRAVVTADGFKCGPSASGLLMAAAAAVRAPSGDLVGVIRAEIVLNGNDELIGSPSGSAVRNRFNDGIYASLFQNGIRVSSNLKLPGGAPAVGTCVASEVYRRVIKHNETVVHPVRISDQRYIAAYEPLKDSAGAVIGMLGAGVPERRLHGITVRSMAVFLLVTLLGLGAAIVVALKLSYDLFKPIRQLSQAAVEIAQGNFSGSLTVKSQDEIGRLTSTFNTMAAVLKERDELLQEQTRRQLTRTERLAAVGRLAAGVAHELNNPMTAVLTFAHLLRDGLPTDAPAREDAETIIEATARCKEIVRGLLNFARQNEPLKRPTDLNKVLGQALNLVRNQASLQRVRIEEQLDPELPQPLIDPHQIDEVAVNLLVNAIDAMPGGGSLTVVSRQTDGERPAVEFEISDTGTGVAPKIFDRIFDPFFTTKPTGKGTGLGLAIAHGIVSEHGGTISVRNRTAGTGAVFTVHLPLQAEETDDEKAI